MSPDARDLAGGGRSFADWADLVVALVCTHLLLFGGGWIAHEQHEARKPKPKPARVACAPPAVAFRYSCVPGEVAEHREACNARERSSRVKPGGVAR